MSRTNQYVAIQDDDGEMRHLFDVADVAEVTPGRLQVVYEDETSEFIPGTLFAGIGQWRTWIQPTYDDTMREYTTHRVLRMPEGHIKATTSKGHREHAGDIKRLRLSNL